MQIKIGATTRRRRRPLRALLFVLFLIIVMPATVVWLVNQQWLLVHILRTVNFGSPTQIAIKDLTWNPLASEIRISGLGIHHDPNGRDGWVGDLSLRYRPLGFLRGKIVVSSLDIHDVRVIIPPTLKTAETRRERIRRRLNIGRLLLLHSLVIESGSIDGLVVAFAKDATFRTDSITWSLKTRLIGTTALDLVGTGITLHKASQPMLTIDTVNLATSTELNRWSSSFPYLNALDGDVTASGIVLQGLSMEQLSASMNYMDSRIDLTKLIVAVGGNNLTGTASADMASQAFNLNIDIPRPIHLPYLGAPSRTFDTAGDLSGHIEVSGSGFILPTSKGSGRLALVHQFTQSPDFPAQITSDFGWSDGAIRLKTADITAGESIVEAKGLIDIARRKLDLTAQGSRFPVEAFFLIFKNPHLRKIYGESDVTAVIGGWGKDIDVKIRATTFDGGFRPILVERAESEIEIGYKLMTFAWKLFQEGRQTGTADLSIMLGERDADGSRRKVVDLTASLDDHLLEPSFPGFKLSGSASGNITLKGPPESFTGTAAARIVKGGWLGIPIDEASTAIALTRKDLTFHDASITPATVGKLTFIEPLIMDLPDGQFRLHGAPLAGLSIDLSYRYDTRIVRINEIRFVPPARSSQIVAVSGTVIPGGAINLALRGNIDLDLLEPLSALVREADGPVAADIRIGGTTVSPALYGTLVFDGNLLSPRPIRLMLEDLTGTLRFEGHRIYADGIAAQVEDGSFSLGGWIEHRNFSLESANVTLRGKGLGFRSAANTFRMEFDGELTLSGAFPHPLLAGEINIIDGRYTKDFVLLEQLGGKRRSAETEEAAITAFDPRLNLVVHNSGDLMIRNNVGDIDLKTDITITGRRSKPQIQGAINVREGRIKYLGFKFDITRGFLEFRGPYAKPYLEVEAVRELRLYNISMRLHGYTDNLAMDLEGTSPSGPLEKRDVVSLLAFGITEEERREYQTARTGGQMGISVAAQQVSQMLERPITEATRLDIFRIESAEEDPRSEEPGKMVTRLRVGKQITDRLSVDFSTDIDTKDAEQTVTSEYLITDSLLIKGSRSSEGKYEGDIGVRFRMR